MAKVKLEKILESMDSFKLNCEVSLLENEGITDLVRAQTRKDLHESFNFIKKELITGGLLEEAQTMLANTWTQAIMEDIEMPSPIANEEDGFDAGDAAALAAGAGAVGAGARYIVPAAQAAYRANVNSGANMTGTAMAGKQALAGQFNADLAAAKGAIDTGAASVANAVNMAQSAPKEIKTGYKMASSNAGLENSIMKHGTVASKLGASVGGRVRRAKNYFNK